MLVHCAAQLSGEFCPENAQGPRPAG